MHVKEKEEKLEIFIPNGPRLGNKVIEAKGVAKAYGDKLLFISENQWLDSDYFTSGENLKHCRPDYCNCRWRSKHSRKPGRSFGSNLAKRISGFSVTLLSFG